MSEMQPWPPRCPERRINPPEPTICMEDAKQIASDQLAVSRRRLQEYLKKCALPELLKLWEQFASDLQDYHELWIGGRNPYN